MSYSSPSVLELLQISKEKCEKNISEALQYIDNDLGNLSRIISSYHPLEILKMAFWYERKVSRDGCGNIASISGRMLPFLLQSMISSTLTKSLGRNREVRKKDWERVISLGEDMTRRLLRFIDNKAVLEVRKGSLTENDLESYRKSLFSEFFPEEKSEEQLLFERERAYSFIENETEKVRETFHQDPKNLSLALYSFAYYSSHAIDDLSSDSSKFKAEVEERIEKLKKDGESGDDEELRRKVFLDPKVYQESLRLQGLRDDFDMFRPEFSSNINAETLDVLSAEPGTLDFKKSLLENGIWPSAAYPFVKIGGMYFSFIGKYLLACAERFFSKTMNLSGRMEASSENAILSFFFKDDDYGVYVFDGNKIDVVLLSSLEEINPLVNPELFHLRLERRREELSSTPKLGHKLLVIDTESDEKMKELGDGRFYISLYELLLIRDDSEKRRTFLSTIFGKIKMDENPIYDDLLDEDEEKSEEDDSIPSEEVKLVLESDDDFQEEKEEKEEVEEEELPSRFSLPDEEIEENRKKYEENRSVIESLTKEEDKAEDEDHMIEEAFDEDEILPADEEEKEDLDGDDEGQLYLFDDDDFDEGTKGLVSESEIKEDTPFEKAEEGFYEEVDEEEVAEGEDVDEDEREEYDQSVRESDENVSSPLIIDGGGETFSLEEEGHDVSELEFVEEDEIVEEPAEAEEEDAETEGEVKEEEPPVIQEEKEEGKVETPPEGIVLEFAEGEKEEERKEEKAEYDEKGGKVFVLSASDVIRDKATGEKTVFSLSDEKEAKGGTIDVASPKYSPFIKAIVEKLGDEKGVFKTFLEKEERPVIEYFERVVRERFEKQKTDGKDKMFSMFDYDLSVILSKNKIYDELRLRELMNNAGAVMYSKGKGEWNVLVLHFDGGFSLEYAYLKHFDKESFSSTDWKIVTVIGEELIRRGR